MNTQREGRSDALMKSAQRLDIDLAAYPAEESRTVHHQPSGPPLILIERTLTRPGQAMLARDIRQLTEEVTG